MLGVTFLSLPGHPKGSHSWPACVTSTVACGAQHYLALPLCLGFPDSCHTTPARPDLVILRLAWCTPGHFPDIVLPVLSQSILIPSILPPAS